MAHAKELDASQQLAQESCFGPSAWAVQEFRCRNVAQKRGLSGQPLVSELEEREEEEVLAVDCRKR